ncbi:MAG: transcriptional regulator [Bacteroidales bacterium]|nr:transcriptional regulator [Bacteroidales bacterium]
MSTGDRVLISPDLTGLSDWTEGRVVEIENNTFNGIVLAAETDDENIFFGKQDLFKMIQKEEECLH